MEVSKICDDSKRNRSKLLQVKAILESFALATKKEVQ